MAFGQESENNGSPQSKENDIVKRNFIATNPVKPIIGLLNLNYEYQIRKKIGISAYSEILAYTVISDFNHPDAINTIGFSFYPFMDHLTINQGAFINLNTSYILYFRDDSIVNSFANGIHIGYKWLFRKNLFLEPKLLLNYTYENKEVLPGLEILMGVNF
ncbi:MAG: hypothetical protein ACFCUU_00810 [Cyclobacteriaceae bacterium]